MIDQSLHIESRWVAEIETRTIEASRLRRRLNQITDAKDRSVIARQLSEVEKEIEAIKHRLWRA